MNIQRPIDPGKDQDLYGADFHAWTVAQRDALARGDASALDWDKLAEEIGDLGVSQERELESRLVVIAEHLLKYEYGTRREPARGWKRTLVVQRDEVERLVRRSPSLRSRIAEVALEGYASARRRALASFEEHEPAMLDTHAGLLPDRLPYEPEALLDPDFLPEPRPAG